MATESHDPALPPPTASVNMASVVREAWLATATLDEVADAPTRQSAFLLVLEAMLRSAGGRSTESPVPVNGAEADSADNGRDDLYSTPELRMDEISLYLKIAGEQVQNLFDVKKPTPSVQVHPSQLSRAKSAATREIALLVVGGRTALGLDTSMDDVRKVVEQYRKYDATSFAKTLQSSPELVVLGELQSAKRTVRLRGIGVSAVRGLAQRLVA